uniref:Transcription factor CBF/NF-Y/archaeal histone domain-containing protein n=1 Tax=Clastoptera arizonana TaxID=38151 RepID=A0A1B6E9U2_9HEMI
MEKQQIPRMKILKVMKNLDKEREISDCAVQAVARATELFVCYLTKKAGEVASGKKISQATITQVIENDQGFEFLRGRIPQKVGGGRNPKRIRETSRPQSDNCIQSGLAQPKAKRPKAGGKKVEQSLAQQGEGCSAETSPEELVETVENTEEAPHEVAATCVNEQQESKCNIS